MARHPSVSQGVCRAVLAKHLEMRAPPRQKPFALLGPQALLPSSPLPGCVGPGLGALS